MSESKLLHRIQLAAAGQGVRLFRNNVGNGYVGKLVRQLPNGDIVLRDWRRVQFGLCPGSSDLIGWRTVTITPDMVGRRLAQFVAVECKTRRVRVTREQRDFLDAVAGSGGLGVIARSVEGFAQVLDELGSIIEFAVQKEG